MNERVTNAAKLLAAALTERCHGVPVTDVFTPHGLGLHLAAALADAGHLGDGIDWKADAERLHAALQSSPAGRAGTPAGNWWRDTGSPACVAHQTLKDTPQ